MPIALGTRLGPYEILASIGAGGMGQVYRARDTRLGRDVAIKVLPDVFPSEPSRERFKREARAASALSHPNICAIHDVGESEGRPFLVMELLQGETLRERIRQGPLPSESILDLGAQIAGALSAAHARGIVHRDIKPANIIITADGQAKVLDFGLAKQDASNPPISGPEDATAEMDLDVTGIGTAMGTVSYMSPEQARGEAVDARSDIWALGVVLYEMATGSQPFTGATHGAVLEALFTRAPAPVRKTNPNIPPELESIIGKALQKDRGLRYQSAADLRADLKRLSRDGSSARLSGPLTAAPQRQWGARWLVAGAIGAALALLAIVLWPSAPRWFGPQEKHIAVLPFTSIGDDPSNQALADGLLESLSNRLSMLDSSNRSLWVVPASEVRRRKVNDAEGARKQFGVTLVVTGALQRDGGGLRLHLTLIDAKNLRQIGGATLEGSDADLASLQNNAMAEMARWMRLPGPSAPARDAAGSAAPAAYESYVKALGYQQRYDKPGNLDRAVTLFEDALKTDPGFALAHAALGETYLLKYYSDQNAHWLGLAAGSCQKAAELDAQLAPVYITLGRIHRLTAKPDLAMQEFQRALALDPRNSDALSGLAGVYEERGRTKEAGETYRRAAAQRPDYWDGFNRLALFYYRQKRYADAEAQFRRVIELTPDNSVAYLNLGASLLLEKKMDEAAAAFQKSIQLGPSYAAYSNLGSVYYRQNKPAQAAALWEKALQMNDQDFRLWFNYGLANRSLALRRDEVAAGKARQGYQRALKLLETKAALQPKEAELHAKLGVLYAYFAQPDKAFRELGTAAALDLGGADTAVAYAEAYELLGDRKRAIESLERGIRKGAPEDEIRRDPEVQPILADPNFHYPTH